MAQTYIDPNTTAAQLVPKIYGARTFTQSLGESFFIGRFSSKDFLKYGDGSLLGTNPSMPIQLLRDLERTSGDTIQYDLLLDIDGDVVYDDDIIEGKAKSLSFGLDQVHITQVRKLVNAGGAMSRKRTKHDMRRYAQDVLRRYYSKYFDEVIVCNLAGTRGEGTNQWVLPTSWSGLPNTSLTAPDTAHALTIDSSGDISHTKTDATSFSLSWLDKIKTYIRTLDVPPNPVYVNGQPKYILILSPKAEEQLKSATAAGSWLDIQKNANVKGPTNPLFKDSLGEYGMFILHSYSKIPYTTSGGHQYSHNLLLGAQAAVLAFGDSGGQFGMYWREETADVGNQLLVLAGSMLGCKKCRFDNDSTDFGAFTVYSLDS